MKTVQQLVLIGSFLACSQVMAQSNEGQNLHTSKSLPVTGIKSVELKNGPLSDFYDLLETGSKQENLKFSSKNREENKPRQEQAEPKLTTALAARADAELRAK